jgi:tRNA A37 threonylcarbamoyladenosine dehydratase
MAFARLRQLLGDAALERLSAARVAVLGLGGVGSYAVEALARSGVGHLLLVDHDRVDTTNINRQIHAFPSTVGRLKCELMRERVLQINPAVSADARGMFLTPENIPALLAEGYDYIIDAVDNVTAKIAIAQFAAAQGLKLISAMGAGNKLDPTRFEVADIYSTSVCPLCRVMRAELKKRGVPALKVVYSKEPPIKTGISGENVRGSTPGSAAFATGVAGLILAGEVVRVLTGNA